MHDLLTQLRLNRLQAEAFYVAPKFDGVRYDSKYGRWFSISNFPLPLGWNKARVAVMIDIPYKNGMSYPQSPLDYFWTDKDLKTNDGRNIKYFYQAGTAHMAEYPEYARNGWGHFCVHFKSWKPVIPFEPDRGDSILTFLEIIAYTFKNRQELAR